MDFKEKLQEAAEKQFDDWFDELNGSYGELDVCMHVGLELDDLESKIEDKILESNCLEEEKEAFKTKFKEEIIKESAKEWFDDRLSDFYDDLANNLEFIDESHIKIYRAIVIKEEDFELFKTGLQSNKFIYDTNGLGVYWSFHENAVDTHWGMNFGSSRVLNIDLVAIVPLDSVDIDRTSFLNMDISCGSDEKEIRLKEDSYVNLIQINDLAVDLLIKA